MPELMEGFASFAVYIEIDRFIRDDAPVEAFIPGARVRGTGGTSDLRRLCARGRDVRSPLRRSSLLRQLRGTGSCWFGRAR